MGKKAEQRDVAAYELRVRGLLGPLLLSSLAHTAARRLSHHSIVITPASERDLVDVLEVIVGSGLEVDSVRTLAAAASGRPASTGVPR